MNLYLHRRERDGRRFADDEICVKSIDPEVILIAGRILVGLMIDYGFELKGDSYVVDNRCGADNSVAAGAGE